MARPLGVAQVDHLWLSALPSALNLLSFLASLPFSSSHSVDSCSLSHAFCGCTCFLFLVDARPSVIEAVWANKQARGPSESQTACCGFLFAGVDPVPGKVFLRCAKRGLKLNGGTATQIFAPPLPRVLSPVPDVLSVLPPP